MDAKHALHDKQKLWEKRLTAISTAAKSKRKSRANQSTTKTKAEKTDARQRMITLRDKRRLQENALCLRRFLPQDTLDAIDTRVTDFEYEIISSKKKGEWRKIWEDPAFESMLSNKLCKALAVVKACKALVLLGRGNSCRATSCGHKNDKEDSASFLLGSDLPDFGGHFRFHQCQMRDDVASFKHICPKMYLNKFELKVAEFEISLLTSLNERSSCNINTFYNSDS